MKTLTLPLFIASVIFAHASCDEKKDAKPARTQAEITADLIGVMDGAKATLEKFRTDVISADEAERRLAQYQIECEPLWKEFTEVALKMIEDDPNQLAKSGRAFQKGKSGAIDKEFSSAKSSLLMLAVQTSSEKELPPGMRAALASILQESLDGI